VTDIVRGGELSHFGDLVKKLRKEKGLMLEAVAKKIGSHKGYVSGIENDKVNPPLVKIIKKLAKLFGQDARAPARLAWVDKAPEIVRQDAEEFLEWVQREIVSPQMNAPSPVETPRLTPPPDSERNESPHRTNLGPSEAAMRTAGGSP
jgi:transcriptional regulator with XRE-family HTH domain